MLWFEKVCEHIPQALDGMKPMLIFPLVGLAFIGLFMCAVNPFMIMLNQAIADILAKIEMAGFADAEIDDGTTNQVTTTSGEVATATQVVLDSGVDAVFVANDSVVQAGVTALVELCTEAGVPTYACSATTVLSGCLATLAMSDVAIGEQTAAMAVKVLEGTPIEEIPCEVVPADIVSVNSDTLAALGLTLPEDLGYGEVQLLSAAN